MDAETRFHSIVVSVTAVIVVFLWLGVSDFTKSHPTWSILLSGAISPAVYRLLVTVFLAAFRHSKLLKRLILGPIYMQGVWIGFFVTRGNKIRFFVEVFEQGLSRTVIRGRSFHDNGTFHGSWIADHAQVDAIRGRLAYHYETDALGNTFVNPGIAVFQLERPNVSKPPVRMAGFSSDLFNPSKLLAFEEKISDDLLFDNAVALEKAREVYEKHKGLIPSQPA